MFGVACIENKRIKKVHFLHMYLSRHIHPLQNTHLFTADMEEVFKIVMILVVG